MYNTDTKMSKTLHQLKDNRWASNLSSRLGLGNTTESTKHSERVSCWEPMQGEHTVQQAKQSVTRQSSVRVDEHISTLLPLPTSWNAQHDRAICALDAQDHSIFNIVAQMYSAFPDLHGQLAAEMVDRRLRQLDQNVDLNYWREEILFSSGNLLVDNPQGRPG